MRPVHARRRDVLKFVVFATLAECAKMPSLPPSFDRPSDTVENELGRPVRP